MLLVVLVSIGSPKLHMSQTQNKNQRNKERTTTRTTTNSEVVAEKLHDQCAVLVGLLAERVKLGNGIIKGLDIQPTLKLTRYKPAWQDGMPGLAFP